MDYTQNMRFVSTHFFELQEQISLSGGAIWFAWKVGITGIQPNLSVSEWHNLSYEWSAFVNSRQNYEIL